MSMRSGKSGKSGVSIRGVQFSRTFSVKNEDDKSSDDSESEASFADSVFEEKKQVEDTGMSWNERMRHQATPMVNRRQDSLDPVICTLFVVTLTRCAEAVTVIRTTNAIPTVEINLEYLPIEEKYLNCEYYELDTIHDESLLTYNKFRRDLSWLEKVLKVAMDNLRRSWSFESFLKVLSDNKLMREDEDQLLMAKKFNQNELSKLRVCAEAERDFVVKTIQELTEELGNKKDQLNDDITEYAVKTRFLRQWEHARYEQNLMTLTGKENSYSETTRTTSINIEREKRVHEEMESYLNESMVDYQKEIEATMEKYDTDLDDYEIRIGKLRIELDKQKETYDLLQEKYDTHQREMDEYKEAKLQKQREKEEEMRRISAATKIQSWWRGIMFRKGLGPFRRKKGGKGKRGGSAKSSGKHSGKKKK